MLLDLVLTDQLQRVRLPVFPPSRAPVPCPRSAQLASAIFRQPERRAPGFVHSDYCSTTLGLTGATQDDAISANIRTTIHKP